VLVTGGSGFIGTRLIESLVSKGARVTSLSRNPREASGKVVYAKGRISDPLILETLVKDKDAIFHLAANADIGKSVESARYDAETNVLGTLNLLECTRKNNRNAPILLISSSAVYGESINQIVKETDPVQPINPYGASKASSEIYAEMYVRKYGMKIVILRPFHAYGSLTRNDFVANTINKVVNGKSPEIHGTGNQIRDFTYVKDIVDIMELAICNPKTFGRVLNCGTGTGVKIVDSVKMVIEIFGEGRQLQPIYREPDSAGRGNICDPTLLKELVGRIPETDLRSGLLKMKSELTLVLHERS